VDVSGLHYIPVALGEIVGSQISGHAMNTIYRSLKNRAGDTGRPEYHISMMLPGAILVPAVLLLYEWAAQAHKHWIVVDIGMFITTLGLQTAGMPTQAYIIGSCPEHASSAIAAS
jgi:hypothetical protein